MSSKKAEYKIYSWVILQTSPAVAVFPGRPGAASLRVTSPVEPLSGTDVPLSRRRVAWVSGGRATVVLSLHTSRKLLLMLWWAGKQPSSAL